MMTTRTIGFLLSTAVVAVLLAGCSGVDEAGACDQAKSIAIDVRSAISAGGAITELEESDENLDELHRLADQLRDVSGSVDLNEATAEMADAVDDFADELLDIRNGNGDEDDAQEAGGYIAQGIVLINMYCAG
ncbi:hypothetical protein [Microbacterium sp. MMO-113]|uniref:hypothetical protein n=1 Tax=Microbacterium sp. MMO-113 TaxID=3081273 RepID=UPI003017A56A